MIDMLDMIAIAAILLIGLPHGALDGAVAMQLRYFQSPLRMAGFFIFYILLAGATIFVWLATPILSLGLFLAISLWHFGLSEPAAPTPALRLARILASGGLTTIYIPLIHQKEVLMFFSLLSGPEAYQLIPFLSLGLPIWAIAAAISLFTSLNKAKDRYWAGEFILLLILLAVLPPLLGFALYFCGVHSRNHFTDIWRFLSQSFAADNLLKGAAILTFASWVAAMAAFWILAPQIGASSAAIQVTFIGLAALTLPHMLLIDGGLRPTKALGKGKQPA